MHERSRMQAPRVSAYLPMGHWRQEVLPAKGSPAARPLDTALLCISLVSIYWRRYKSDQASVYNLREMRRGRMASGNIFSFCLCPILSLDHRYGFSWYPKFAHRMPSLSPQRNGIPCKSLRVPRARGARQLRLLAQHEEAARCCRRRSGRGCTCHGGVGSSGALGAGRAACKGKPRSSAARHAASRVHDPAPTLDRLPALCIPLVHLKTIPRSYALCPDSDSFTEKIGLFEVYCAFEVKMTSPLRGDRGMGTTGVEW